MSKVTDLTEFTGTPAYNDVIHFVDVSDQTDDPEGSSYKITVGSLLSKLGVGIQVPGYAGYSVFKGSGNTDLSDIESGDRIEGAGAFFGGDFVIAVCNSNTPAVNEDFDTPIFRAASI